MPRVRSVAPIVLGCCCALLSTAAGAQTLVRPEGRVLHITIPIQFVISAVVVDGKMEPNWYGRPSELTDPVTFETVSLAQYMTSWNSLASLASDVWNGAFQKLRYRGCYELRVKTELNFVPVAAEGDSLDEEFLALLKFIKPGFHYIILKDSVMIPGSDGIADPVGDPTRDIPHPYVRVQFGVMGFESPGSIAHELGHLMGLGDDYTRVFEDGELVVQPKPGREGTFMAQAASRNIDQELVDRVGDLASRFVDLPPCLYARFEWHSQAPQDRGSGRLEVAEISLGLGKDKDKDKDGGLEGNGTHTISGDLWIEHSNCKDYRTWKGFSTFPAIGHREDNHVTIDCQNHLTEVVLSDTGCTLGGPISVKQPAPVPVCVFEADLVDGRFESEETKVWGAGPANMVTRILIEDRGGDPPK